MILLISSKYAEHLAKWVEIGVGGRKPGNFKRGNISISKKALDSLGEFQNAISAAATNQQSLPSLQMYSDKQEFFSTVLRQQEPEPKTSAIIIICIINFMK